MPADPTPQYPDIRVSVASGNPLVLVSAVRLALRRAGADRRAIDRFSREALAAAEPAGVARTCRRWVAVDPPLDAAS